MTPKPNLVVIDGNSGEIADDCPNCSEMAKQLAGAETDVRAWRQRFANLKRDKEAEAAKHDLFPSCLALFRFWQQRTDHPQAQWTAARFEMIEPLLRKYGTDRCRAAIRGAAFDPYVTARKNGKPNRHDGFDLIFRSAAKLEEFEARDPEPVPTLAQLSLIEHAQEVANRVLERARLIESGEDPRAIAELLVEIHRLNLRWLAIPFTPEADEGSQAD